MKNQHNISMSDFNIGNFNKFGNYQNPGVGGQPLNPAAGANKGVNGGFQLTNDALNHAMAQKNLADDAVLTSFSPTMLRELKMNNLANLERSLYLKDLMNLPKDLEEVLVLIQSKTSTSEEATKLLAKNINMSVIAELIQTGSKEAMNKLVMIMANASKQGLTDNSQIKDMMKLLNASVSVAGQENSNQVLKSFMLLYLPWVPLQEGVDFQLEIGTPEEEGEKGENSITIMISTRNYGNVKVTLVLLQGHSLSIFVNCSDKFPKEELLKRLKTEGKNHSILTDVSFEQSPVQTDTKTETPQAKVSMSTLTEINPFLLIMANAVIRHTIEIDNLAGI